MSAPTRTDKKAEDSLAVRVGRITVRIYERPADRGRAPRFDVADYSTGKRKWRSFPDLATAKAEATRIAHLLRAGDVEGAKFTGDERREFLRATELVSPFGLDLVTAATLFAEGAKLVGPHQVVPACEDFNKRHPASRERVPLPQAVDEYLGAKESKRRSPRHLATLRSLLGRFAEAHPGKAISDFRTPDVQHWLDGLKREDGKPASAQTRRNFAVVVGGMFEHYRRRGFLADNPFKDIEREKAESEGDVEFWSPDEASALLRAADHEVLPALAVSLFAGVRSAEVCRLKWSAVDFQQGHIEIGAKGAKTRSRRLAPLTDNLRRWLLPLRGEPDAPLFPGRIDAFSKEVTATAEAAGVRRIPNGARHSFITFRTALIADVSRVALEAGNSPSVIFSHYRGLATKSDAERYFAIAPDDGAAVVPFPKEATG